MMRPTRYVIRLVGVYEAKSIKDPQRCSAGAAYRPQNSPASGPTEPSGNRRRGSGGTGIPNLSCQRIQTSFVNTPVGGFSSTLRNSSNGTYRWTTFMSLEDP